MSTSKPDYRRFNDCAPIEHDKQTGAVKMFGSPPSPNESATWAEHCDRCEVYARDRERHVAHANYKLWQDAVTMNMVFGDDYVTTPPIPKGYEKLAQQWHNNLKPVR